ncbi:MAG: DUF177 domain-containing protein [Oligoflexia bacterium]|nr:DUF177 domain-containing protein [Oligoflexia bacterium]
MLEIQTVNVRKFPLNNETIMQLNNNDHQWPKLLLDEMEGDGFQNQEKENRESYLNLSITIIKKENSELLEHIFLTGNINARYRTLCVRCVEEMYEQIDVDFKVCFIPSSLEKSELYADQLTLYTDHMGEVDLYFYSDNIVDIKEFIHELIFLNLNQLPLHTEECKGLCQVCGENLNEKICVHQQESCCTL